MRHILSPWLTPLLAALLLIGGLSSCGYRLAGGGSLPANVRTICVSIFENRSRETGMENLLVDDLMYEFTRNGQKVVADPGGAQAVLSGTITSVSVDTVSYGADRTSLESRVTLVADLFLRSSTGEELWSVRGLVERQAFGTSRDDSQVGDANRQDALALASRRFAESVYARMTDDF
jgi:outer membrane lipopolysaccharide assembly protein LptE/RlpB